MGQTKARTRFGTGSKVWSLFLDKKKNSRQNYLSFLDQKEFNVELELYVKYGDFLGDYALIHTFIIWPKKCICNIQCLALNSLVLWNCFYMMNNCFGTLKHINNLIFFNDCVVLKIIVSLIVQILHKLNLRKYQIISKIIHWSNNAILILT